MIKEFWSGRWKHFQLVRYADKNLYLYTNSSVNFIEIDTKTGTVLNIIGKPLWFWAE